MPELSNDSGGPADTQAELQRTVLLTGVDLAQFLGHRDQLIADLERQHPAVQFHARDHVLTLSGPAVQVKAAEQVVSDVSRWRGAAVRCHATTCARPPVWCSAVTGRPQRRC